MRNGMFSENQKISARQLRALLLTDWMGKILLLLPAALGRVSGWNALLGAGLGILLAAGAGWLLSGMQADRPQGEQALNYYQRLKKAAGRRAADFIFLIYMVYLVGQCALTFYLCGQVAHTYLLPEVDFWVLLLFPLLLGYYLAGSGLEVRGRVSELTASLIWGLFFLMLLLSLPGVSTEQLKESAGRLNGTFVLVGVYVASAGFGAVGLMPLVLSRLTEEAGWRERRRMVCAAVGAVGLLLAVAGIASFGIFGPEGMSRLRWPVVSLMSCANLQGVFLQRWDVLLIGILVFGLFLAAGGSIYYTGVLAENLSVKRNPAMLGAAVLAWAAALCMDRYGRQAEWYGSVALLFCAPLMAGTALLLMVYEKHCLGRREERARENGRERTKWNGKRKGRHGQNEK